jgi:hypothetical protein
MYEWEIQRPTVDFAETLDSPGHLTIPISEGREADGSDERLSV